MKTLVVDDDRGLLVRADLTTNQFSCEVAKAWVAFNSGTCLHQHWDFQQTIFFQTLNFQQTILFENFNFQQTIQFKMLEAKLMVVNIGKSASGR